MCAVSIDVSCSAYFESCLSLLLRIELYKLNAVIRYSGKK